MYYSFHVLSCSLSLWLCGSLVITMSQLTYFSFVGLWLWLKLGLGCDKNRPFVALGSNYKYYPLALRNELDICSFLFIVEFFFPLRVKRLCRLNRGRLGLITSRFRFLRVTY